MNWVQESICWPPRFLNILVHFIQANTNDGKSSYGNSRRKFTSRMNERGRESIYYESVAKVNLLESTDGPDFVMAPYVHRLVAIILESLAKKYSKNGILLLLLLYYYLLLRSLISMVIIYYNFIIIFFIYYIHFDFYSLSGNNNNIKQQYKSPASGCKWNYC